MSASVQEHWTEGHGDPASAIHLVLLNGCQGSKEIAGQLLAHHWHTQRLKMLPNHTKPHTQPIE
jgi:hypothetical protein